MRRGYNKAQQQPAFDPKNPGAPWSREVVIEEGSYTEKLGNVLRDLEEARLAEAGIPSAKSPVTMLHTAFNAMRAALREARDDYTNGGLFRDELATKKTGTRGR